MRLGKVESNAMTDHELRALSTDAVIDVDGSVVLLERDHPPHEGSWVLPGGLVERQETAREACVREVREEVDLDVEVIEFVGLYDDPDRDERGNVSAAFRCRPHGPIDPTPREEARRVDFFYPDDLPETGFDHAQIIADAFSLEPA
ncbi:MAG: NUDIX domain-containing protein [Natronomonas sp.]